MFVQSYATFVAVSVGNSNYKIYSFWAISGFPYKHISTQTYFHMLECGWYAFGSLEGMSYIRVFCFTV